jgi:nucleoside-diphosphate-sugar epimerase
MTGGYGCIGSWVARQLVEQGEEVWIYDLQEDTHRLDLLLDEDQRRRVHFVPGDVADPAAFLDAVDRLEATHLLHLAGLQTPTCRANPILGARVNVLGTLAVLEAAARHKGQVQRVVYASSAAVHGPAGPDPAGPVADEVRLMPVTHYGAFKVCNELNARVYWLDHGVSSVGLRPWTVYGVGRDFGMTSEPTKAIKAVAAGRPYRISYGGTQDLQYAPDVAATFLRASSRPWSPSPRRRRGSSPTATGSCPSPPTSTTPASTPGSGRSPAPRSATASPRPTGGSPPSAPPAGSTCPTSPEPEPEPELCQGGSMAEVAAAGEDHGHAVLVAGGEGLVVALRAAGLDDRRDPGGGGDVGAVAEREEGVGGEHGARRPVARLRDGDPD